MQAHEEVLTWGINLHNLWTALENNKLVKGALWRCIVTDRGYDLKEILYPQIRIKELGFSGEGTAYYKETDIGRVWSQ